MGTACCSQRDRINERDLGPEKPLFTPHASVAECALGPSTWSRAKSAKTLKRQMEAQNSIKGSNMFVYNMVDCLNDPGFEQDGQSACHPLPGRRRQRAQHFPPNSSKAVPIETRGFVGHGVFMFKPPNAPKGAEYPYSWHLANRKRRWEVRMQGKFRRPPTGDMFIGIVQGDFGYDCATASSSKMVTKTGIMLAGSYDVYISWGDRWEASHRADAELAQSVTGPEGWDQIVVSKPGDRLPDITGEVGGLGLERKSLGVRKYKKEFSKIQFNCEDTYTLCFWGVSQIIDLPNWQFKFGTSIPMQKFFGDKPLHVVFYDIDKEDIKRDKGKHLECRKRYIADWMFWSNAFEITDTMPDRYEFLDCPKDLLDASLKTAYRDPALNKPLNGNSHAAPAKAEKSSKVPILVAVAILAVVLALVLQRFLSF